MLAARSALATLALAFWGCSEVLDFGVHCEPPNPILSVTLHGPDVTGYAAACPGRAELPDLHARVDVRGYPTREMRVDAESLETSVTMAIYSGEPTRAALVTYSAGDPPDWVIGYHVVEFDLSDPRCDATLDVDLGAAAIAWLSPDDVAAASESTDTASVWAREQIHQSLDSDADGCTNLDEACRGTLGVADASGCP